MKEVKRVFYTTIHPIDSFWNMKFQHQGKVKNGVCICVIFFLTMLFNRQVRAFPFNTDYHTPLNIGQEFVTFLVPLFLFCIGNWTITTLMDGKGTLKDIFLVVAYALVPVIIFRIPMAIISNVMTLEDVAYLNMIDAVSIIWAAILVFVGIMTVHQYTFIKTIATLILTVCSVMVIVFVSLLLFSLLQELCGFIYSVYREITLRL